MLFSYAFEFAFAWLLFEAKFSELFESVVHMLPPSLVNFMGVNIGSAYYGAQMLAFGYSHPLILISLSILPIGLSARYITAEIENKTMDLLMSRSIHRSVIPGHLFIFLLFALAIQTTALFAGTYTGYLFFDLKINPVEYAKVAMMTFFFFLSMGSFSLAVSTFQNERGKTIAKGVSIFVILYFYDTVIRLNQSLEHLTAYSYFNLYQPSKLLRGQLSIENSLSILVAIIFVFLSIAIIRFNKCDL
jgi:ABC-type transport system involved in multi-copper enzyme maturation permease subunit